MIDHDNGGKIMNKTQQNLVKMWEEEGFGPECIAKVVETLFFKSLKDEDGGG